MTELAESAGLANRVRSAVFWRSGSQIVAQLLMWTATIIVVRLLDPQDYGLFAMATIIQIALAFLNAHSFATSLVQEKDLPEGRIAQVFGVLLILNVCLAAAQFLVAPYVAAYYNQPILTQMIHVQSLTFLIMPFISLPQVLLARNLDFKSQARADMAGAISGAVTALSGAYAGLGVWTLIIAPIMQQFVRAIGLCHATKHLVWPRFDFRGMGSIFSFGSALVLCQFFWVIQSQSDVAIAGRMLGPHNLGLYSEALFLALIFTAKFIPPLNEVAFPAYTELLKAGGNMGKAFITAARTMMFIAVPFYLGLSVVARPMVATVLGPKWMEMVPLLEGMTLAMPFFALQIICSPTTNALGKPRIYVATSAIGAAIMVTAFAVGAQFGLHGLVHAWQIGMPLLLVSTLALTLPKIGVKLSTLLRSILPSVAAGIAMYGVVKYAEPHLAHLAPPIELAAITALGGAVYLGLLWRFSRDTITDLYRMIVKKEFGSSADQG
jgi:O-antigen/teichoic acid export membrane protein